MGYSTYSLTDSAFLPDPTVTKVAV